LLINVINNGVAGGHTWAQAMGGGSTYFAVN